MKNSSKILLVVGAITVIGAFGAIGSAAAAAPAAPAAAVTTPGKTPEQLAAHAEVMAALAVTHGGNSSDAAVDAVSAALDRLTAADAAAKAGPAEVAPAAPAPAPAEVAPAPASAPAPAPAMPSVICLDGKTAEQMIRDTGVKRAVIRFEDSSGENENVSYPEYWTVVEQTPVAGTLLNAGDKIVLSVFHVVGFFETPPAQCLPSKPVDPTLAISNEWFDDDDDDDNDRLVMSYDENHDGRYDHTHTTVYTDDIYTLTIIDSYDDDGDGVFERTETEHHDSRDNASGGSGGGGNVPGWLCPTRFC